MSNAEVFFMITTTVLMCTGAYTMKENHDSYLQKEAVLRENKELRAKLYEATRSTELHASVVVDPPIYVVTPRVIKENERIENFAGRGPLPNREVFMWHQHNIR